MTGIRREPDPTRPCITTGEAARILKCRPITVRSRIERGNIEGGQKPSGKWYVYADQPDLRDSVAGADSTTVAPASGSKKRRSRDNAQVAELRTRLEEVDAAQASERAAWEARHRADQNRIETILAVNAAALNAGEDYKSAAEGSAKLLQEAVAGMVKFKDAADKWMAVAGMWRDLMAQENMPDDPRELDGG